MRKAFTLIEYMIVIAIAAIILAIAIPNIVVTPQHKTPSGRVIEYRDVVGKTFQWNGNPTLIVDYEGYQTYVVVIMPTSGGAVNVTVDRNVIMEAYKLSLAPPVTLEKVEK